jgi:hypothetical protein
MPDSKVRKRAVALIRGVISGLRNANHAQKIVVVRLDTSTSRQVQPLDEDSSTPTLKDEKSHASGRPGVTAVRAPRQTSAHQTVITRAALACSPLAASAPFSYSPLRQSIAVRRQ